ncbi:MAG TPA: NAD(P)-binding protein, partial [Burkholderiales bacterium]|nr:NAD(P)-binding protein [Burkholderiales bacterium]
MLILGAGAAGLAAAQELARAGRRALVLEAR